MNRGFFITGTDTGVGKTCVSLGLMQALQSQGYSVVAMKPVASGCVVSTGGLRNEDAQQLRDRCSIAVPYEQVNPYAFEPAIAPHLAAEAAGIRLEMSVIASAFEGLAKLADKVVVEGVGGWMVPINNTQTMADVALMLDMPVIMVVGIRLGCLNHAILTADAIKRSGMRLAGWVANRIDSDCERQDENVGALRRRLDAPLLADFGYIAGDESRVNQFGQIDLQQLAIS